MLFFKPRGAWCADVIPFFHDGTFHLFYLKSYRDREAFGEGTPWAHVSTRDFVHFEEHPDAIAPGGPMDQDLWPFTGSVIERDGVFHIFYTGHNPHLEGTGGSVNGILHATSPDLITWHKDPAFTTFLADPTRYEMHDWRDPFVFWNDAAGEYWMLFAARLKGGPRHRRGCVALAASTDLVTWELREPFWAPGWYHTHECPDLFREGDRWYLLFSTFDDRMATHVRSAATLNGPWTAIGDGAIDGPTFYAAKTASDGQRRFAFGWLPSHARDDLAGAPLSWWTPSMDASGWLWGGQMVVHEVEARSDGSLATRAPAEVLAAFGDPLPTTSGASQGTWTTDADGTIRGSNGDGHAWALLGELPETCLVRATLTVTENVQEVGLLLRSSAAVERYYRLRLDPGAGRVAFERYPRPAFESSVVERPFEVPPGVPVELTLLIDGSAFVAYLDGSVALTCRGSDHVRGALGLFLSGGAVTVRGLEIRPFAP